MFKILIIFGTRPEAIKMAPLIKKIQSFPKSFEIQVCVTGQHREMLDQVLNIFDIIPEYDLSIMKKKQDLFDLTSSIILGIRDILKKEKPDIVLVHGDTTTSTISALASFYEKINVGHIEAGLRTYNMYSPWPEEINRQLTSRIAKYHFSPTNISKNNLLNEGINKENIFITGNTVIDALFWVINKIKSNPNIENNIIKELKKNGLKDRNLKLWIEKKRKLILITGHRRENFGKGFINICQAIDELSDVFPNVDFVYPMHLNPNVRYAVENVFGKIDKITKKNIYFIEPLEYFPFVYLMDKSYIILTDSGGIQEEAPSLKKPVLVLRNTTERPEAVEVGTVRLVGTKKNNIIKEVKLLIEDKKTYSKMEKTINPYGDGKASDRIIKELLQISK